MVEVGGVMDAVCQESGELGGAQRCPDNQYLHAECMTLHMHLMNQQVYLLITRQDTPSHSSQCAKSLCATQIMASYFTQKNLQMVSTFLYFYPLTLSHPLQTVLSFIAGNSPCTLHAVLGNATNLLSFFSPLTK